MRLQSAATLFFGNNADPNDQRTILVATATEKESAMISDGQGGIHQRRGRRPLHNQHLQCNSLVGELFWHDLQDTTAWQCEIGLRAPADFTALFLDKAIRLIPERAQLVPN